MAPAFYYEARPTLRGGIPRRAGSTDPAMLGYLIALVVILVMLYIVYRYASKCHQGQGGVLCKLWSWIA